MAASSLIKFANRVKSPDGRKLFWGRAEADGMPYRGAYAPMMNEDEYEARVVKVADVQLSFFDVTDADQNAEYRGVIEACDGWFQLLHLERFWNGTTKHYVEWLEYYMEDGTRTKYTPQGVMEVGPNGQGNFTSNP